MSCLRTSEDIKAEVDVPTFLRQQGIEIRRGMCHCFVHGADKHPSMKVYPDGVHCFACGFNGDIFGIYQQIFGCDFKTAYIALGGQYEKPVDDFTAEMNRRKYERQRAEKEAQKKAEKKFYEILTTAMDCCRNADKIFEIWSDDWCYLTDHREWLGYVFEQKYIEREEVNEVDVIRVCEQIRRRICTL